VAVKSKKERYEMPYMLLIVEPRGQRQARTEEEGRELYAKMLRWGEDLRARGVYIGSNSLLSDAQGVRVAIRDGKRSILDGPFAESKEMVGGYYLLDCASREQAIALAEECPAAQWATVEVRELGPCHSG
jgi:hypothetical protein